MAIGKSKKIWKKAKGKKQIDPLSRKEWYQLRAPVPFKARPFGYSLVTRTTGTKIASEQIKGRVVEASFSDLKEDSENLSWRKVKLILDEVDGHFCKTSFYGLDITKDKLYSMIRKWQTLIEAFTDVKTADGYIMRIFVIAFTKKNARSTKKTSYAKSSHIREIRKKIQSILNAECSKVGVNEIIRHFTSDLLTNKIETQCKYIYPLQNVCIRKVKVLKRPKIDAIKMNEMYSHEKKTQYAAGSKDASKEEEEDDGAQNLLKAAKQVQK